VRARVSRIEGRWAQLCVDAPDCGSCSGCGTGAEARKAMEIRAYLPPQLKASVGDQVEYELPRGGAKALAIIPPLLPFAGLALGYWGMSLALPDSSQDTRTAASLALMALMVLLALYLGRLVGEKSAPRVTSVP
jgi:hypothetical protein